MRKRAILVDDDKQIVTLLRIVLKQRGYEVVAYSDEADFRSGIVANCACSVNQRCTDVMLVDLNLKRSSGLDLIKKLREKGCRVPNIALMTGHWTDELLAEAKALDCATFGKPFALSDVEAWVSAGEAAIDPERELTPILPIA